MGVVAFDPAAFIVNFPQFATVSADALNYNFARAQQVLDNTDCSPVVDLTERALLLDLLVAHITALNQGVNGVAPSGLVGRVSGATQGSIRVDTDYGETSKAAAWYLQTPWGAEYWNDTAKYRTMRYRPGRSYPAPPQPLPGLGFGWRWRQ
jgi:hypothetical protein